VFAGVQDALVQWWYGHNAVAFFLTTPDPRHHVLLPAEGG
jgi:cbb3-type cytochrome oxidase subunit 1